MLISKSIVTKFLENSSEMSKFRPRSIYLTSVFLLTTGFSSIAFQVRSSSPEDLLCYTIKPSGRVQNLDPLCKNVNNPNNRMSDNPKVAIVDKGRRFMRDKQYQEAVSVFTQAVNEYPNFAEAYMGRAYSNHALGAGGDTVIGDFRNAEQAYRNRGQPKWADNISRLIKQYKHEKLGIE
jgi:tetratricopeptide (TPR) repeat protein